MNLVLPGWSEVNLISGIKDDGDKFVFLDGCRELVKFNWWRDVLLDVSDGNFDPLCGLVTVLLDAEFGDVADQRELFGD